MAGKKRVAPIAKAATGQVEKLLADIRNLILSARRAIVRSVDTLQVLTSFEIGRRIVEHEQQGAARAEYGKRVLGELADRLTEEFGRGYSRSNLQNMRNFFLVYRDRSAQICQMTSGKWKAGFSEKRQTASGKSGPRTPFVPGPPAQFTQPFPLGWSQYVFSSWVSTTWPNARSTRLNRHETVGPCRNSSASSTPVSTNVSR